MSGPAAFRMKKNSIKHVGKRNSEGRILAGRLGGGRTCRTTHTKGFIHMRKAISIGVIILAVLAMGVVYIYYQFQERTMVPADLEETTVAIPTNSSFEEVVDILTKQGIVRDEMIFRQLAEYMKYERNPMRAGRYEVKPGWSMIRLIRHLRGGPQAPVDVILTNERLPRDVAGKVGRFIEADSVDFVQLFNDESYLQQIGYSKETLMSLFIPNTYEFFWNTSPKEFMERMIREHEAFWKRNDRLEKAEKIGLSPKEIYTLASIVEKETLRAEEKSRIAGVYLNRLRRGMLLQADPTSVFARGDFETPRVTDYHTKFDSPYNTYMYAGLPPGPIAMASISSIDGVLNAEGHDYLFFCAVGDGSGKHAFAETLAGHNQNARRYRENLRRRGLR